jgi:hypothetical protein
VDSDETLKNYRELADKGPDAYLPDEAESLNNLSFLDNTQNHRNEAPAHLSESLTIGSTLAGKNLKRFSAQRDAVAKELATVISLKWFG